MVTITSAIAIWSLMMTTVLGEGDECTKLNEESCNKNRECVWDPMPQSCSPSPCTVAASESDCLKLSGCVYDTDECIQVTNCTLNTHIECDLDYHCFWDLALNSCVVTDTESQCFNHGGVWVPSNSSCVNSNCSAWLSQQECSNNTHCEWNATSMKCLTMSEQEECIHHGGQWNSSDSSCASMPPNSCAQQVTQFDCLNNPNCTWNITCLRLSEQEICTKKGGTWDHSHDDCDLSKVTCSMTHQEMDCLKLPHCSWDVTSCVIKSDEQICTESGGTWHTANHSCNHDGTCATAHDEAECHKMSHCKWDLSSCLGMSDEEECTHDGGMWHSSNNSCTHSENCVSHGEDACNYAEHCHWNHQTTLCEPAPSEICEQLETNITCNSEPECYWVASHHICIERPEPHEEEEEDTAQDYFFITIIIVFAFSTVRIVQKVKSKALSESAGVIICGAIIGGIMYFFEYLIDGDLDSHIQFDEEIFALFILPPIIFEAGFTLEHKGVMRNLGTILLYAVFGTLISACVIGFLVYAISSFTFKELADHPGAPFIALAFGALLSAVDPVAVIAVLGQKFDLKKPPLLYNLVFGEAVLNDAVSIVLYNVMITFVDQEMTATSLVLAALDFTKISILSCFIGYFYGCLCSLFVKHIDFTHHPSIEIIIIGAFALGSYYLAEMLSLSGIMSLFICGRIEGHHAMYNLSQDARESAVFIFKTLAHLAETYVFVLLGQAFWAFGKHNWNFSFIGMVYLIMLFARAVNVFPMSAVANTNRKRQKVTGKMQFFMWFSGLRGAIAFGLSLIMLTRAVKDEKSSKDPSGYISVDIAKVFVSTTLMMVVLTVVIMGAFTEYLLAKLNLADGGDAPAQCGDRESPLIMNEMSPNMSPSEPQESNNQPPRSKALMFRLAMLDEKYISPILRTEICHVSYIHPHEAGIVGNAAAGYHDPKVVEMDDAVVVE